MLSESIAAIFDCSVAEISIVFAGRVHREVIALEDDAFDLVCEIDRMLSIFKIQGGDADESAWIDRSKEPGKVYFGFPEYMVSAASTLAAIFETYPQEKFMTHVTSLVDHQGNIAPLDIERK